MPCCQCCTKQRTAQIFLVLGAAVLIASFVIAAALVQVVSNALRSNAIIPTPDQSNWRDWLSNIPSQQRNGDAAATFYTFYFFNLTNLNDVALNGTTPALTERGPYVYQSFSQKIESTVSYNADNSQVSYQTWSWKQFRSDLSYGNDDYNDYFILPDPVYQNAFGWAGSPFAGLPEGGARVALAPLVWGALYDRVFARLALQDGSSSRIVFSSSTTAIIHVFLGPQTISYNGGTYNSFSSLFTPLLNNVSRTRVFPTMPDIEYYRIVGTTVDTALAFAFADLPNLGALYNNATNGIIAPVGPLASTAALVGCTDFRLLNTSSSFRCWSALPGAVVQSGQDLATTFGLMSAAIGGKFTSKQMQGLYVWLGVISGVCPLCPLFARDGVAGLTSYSTSALQLDKSWAEWALKSMGHLGRGLAGLNGTKGFTSENNVYPTFPSTGVRFYSTGNAYVSRNPRSIAYENTNIFSGVALASSSVIDPLATGIFTNYSSPAYAMVFNYVETDGTGQKNITDADSIYRFNNFVAVGAGKTAPGTPGIRFCNSTLSFYNVQDGFTKATPRYAPGIVGTNPFSIGKSVLDKNFVIDVWSSDISRRIQLAYLNDADMSDIKLIRYNFSYPNLLVNYDLSQPFQGVLSSECSSGTVLLTLPHWQAADIFPSPATTTSMFAVGLAVKPDITYLSNAIIARDNTPPSGGDISDLQPFLDLEPYSGALMRGSLREQVNLYFSNAIPAGATNVSVSPGLEIVGMNPARYTVWPVFWVNRNGQATSKQIDTFKSGVYGVTTAATVILIVGSIIGGLTFVISFVLLVKYAREDSERTPYGTQPSSTNLNM